MFRTVPLSIIKSFSLYARQWYMSCSLLTACEQAVTVTRKTYTTAVCTVKNP